MKLVTLKLQSREIPAIRTAEGFISIEVINKHLNKNWHVDLYKLITSGQLNYIQEWYSNHGKSELENLSQLSIPLNKAIFAPPYRHPRKIWGIGLNYREHAHDLDEISPTSEPASFMKPDTTIIGDNDPINIPLQSEKTTGEAELGIIIRTKCKDIEREDWLSVVAGFTPIIDITAEDILRKNPRFLTLSKSFDTFFSFGPELLTPDEIGDVLKLKVATVINGEIYGQNTVSNMIFPPDYLVAFHSRVMTLLPGDIISTGTPRAVPLKNGDRIESHIDNFISLLNPVVDLKLKNSS